MKGELIMSEFLVCITMIVMLPSAYYGSISIYLFFFWLFHIRKYTFKRLVEELRLSDDFLETTRKPFWLIYTPLLIIVLILSFYFQPESQDSIILWTSILGYISLLLFSGYIPKNNEHFG